MPENPPRISLGDTISGRRQLASESTLSKRDANLMHESPGWPRPHEPEHRARPTEMESHRVVYDRVSDLSCRWRLGWMPSCSSGRSMKAFAAM